MKAKLALAIMAIILSSPVCVNAITPYSMTHYPILLVNKTHPLVPLTYAPAKLVPVEVPTAETSEDLQTFMYPTAAVALEHMFDNAQKDGVYMLLASGYRSYYDQLQLQQASQLTTLNSQEYIAPPGHSEHQTGLAADIIESDYFCAGQGCFAFTKAAAWLALNAYHYGFIVRYSAYQQLSTGYNYEPWHIRYVGPALAKILQNKQETLEQYYGYP